VFKTLSEEQYLETVNFSKKVYREEVIRNNDVTAPSFTLQLKRGRAEYAFNKKQNMLATNEEKTIFKLNLVINNNELFSHCFLDCCSKYFNEQDIKKIIVLFGLRKTILADQWNDLINYISQLFCVSTGFTTLKIAEILSFHNVYYEELETNTKEQTKSLSK